jgi:hypothetical protein
MRLEPHSQPQLRTSQADTTKETTIEDWYYEVNLRISGGKQKVGKARAFLCNGKWRCELTVTLPKESQISEAEGQEISDDVLKYIFDFMGTPKGQQIVSGKSTDRIFKAFERAHKKWLKTALSENL